MNLKTAQQILWDDLTIEKQNQHLLAYKTAKTNLENGIDKTIINYGNVENNAPAATYFQIENSYDHQANIVGRVLHDPDGNVIVVFESQDIKDLLEIYFGNNILN
jgi:hypothetical protein